MKSNNSSQVSENKSQSIREFKEINNLKKKSGANVEWFNLHKLESFHQHSKLVTAKSWQVKITYKGPFRGIR